jgi:hypothetical protein
MDVLVLVDCIKVVADLHLGIGKHLIVTQVDFFLFARWLALCGGEACR